MINNVHNIPSDTRSEVILEEDQNSEVPLNSSDNKCVPPQEIDEDFKSQPKQKSYNIKLITKSFLFRKRMRSLFSTP